MNSYNSCQYLRKRGVLFSIILTLLTFGLYQIFWMIRLNNELRRETNQRADGILMFFLSFLTCGLVGLYWLYRMGMDLSLASKNSSNIEFSNSEAILYPILGILSFGLLALAILQHRENLLCEEF